jgi:predicted permease
MPRWSDRIRERLAGRGLNPATENEIVEELAQHLEARYRDQLARGASDVDAERAAWRELDADDAFATMIARERRAPMTPLPPPVPAGGSPVRALWDDVKFAWRRLRHAPGFAITAIVTLTLTIGANTAILSIADAVLFRPLPYRDPGQIAILQVRDPKSGQAYTQFRYAFIDAIDASSPSVSEVATISPTPAVSIDTTDGPTAIPAMAATPGYFALLGVLPARGRIFTEADSPAGEGRVAMLSYSVWQRRFGADESVVGRAVAIGNRTFDIAGVLPPGFVFPSLFAGSPGIVVLGRPTTPGSTGATFHPIVRVSPGVSFEAAQAEIDAATAPVAAKLTKGAAQPALFPVRNVLYPVGRPIMQYLLAAALLILMLGCANLANMMLVRGRRAMHETAVRLALGASRSRLIRPVLIEAVMISLGAALVAVLATGLLFDALVELVPRAAYGRAPVGLDRRVAILSLTLSLLSAVAFSLIPAWRAGGIDVLALLRQRGRHSRARRGFGRPLLVVQVSVAVAVVFGAVIAARAFVDVLNIPLGFSPDRVVRFSVGTVEDRTAAERQVFHEQVVGGLRSRPEILAAGAAGSTPFSGQAPDSAAMPLDRDEPRVGLIYALPGYFEALQIEVTRGRGLTAEDLRGPQDAAVVSASAARALFGDREAIGSRFRDSSGHIRTVVGVVTDVKTAIDRPDRPLVYAMPGPKARALVIVAKFRERRDELLLNLRQHLQRELGLSVPVLHWYDDEISEDNAYRNPRFQTLVLGSLAGLALSLTALGIFSVVAYVVTARTREMGVRLAIGASPGSLVGLMVREALVPVGAGLVGGLLLAKWGSKLAETQLFKVDTADMRMLVVAAGTVVVAATLAAYLPARRATRINPAQVLRAD